MHAPHEPAAAPGPSSRHAYVTPDDASLVKENDALAEFVRPDGPPVMDVSGGGGGVVITSCTVLTAIAPAVTRDYSQSSSSPNVAGLIAHPLSQIWWITICAQPPLASAFVTTVLSSASV